MTKKRGRPKKPKNPTTVNTTSLISKELMAQIIFEGRYLIGKNTNRQSRNKTHLCEKYNISTASYYLWEKKLNPSHQSYDSEFEKIFKDLVYEFFTQEDNAWLIKSREVYAEICEMMSDLSKRMRKEINNDEPITSNRLSAINLCGNWGLRSQEAYMMIRDLEETKDLVNIYEQN